MAPRGSTPPGVIIIMEENQKEPPMPVCKCLQPLWAARQLFFLINKFIDKNLRLSSPPLPEAYILTWAKTVKTECNRKTRFLLLRCILFKTESQKQSVCSKPKNSYYHRTDVITYAFIAFCVPYNMFFLVFAFWGIEPTLGGVTRGMVWRKNVFLKTEP